MCVFEPLVGSLEAHDQKKTGVGLSESLVASPQKESPAVNKFN